MITPHPIGQQPHTRFKNRLLVFTVEAVGVFVPPGHPAFTGGDNILGLFAVKTAEVGPQGDIKPV